MPVYDYTCDRCKTVWEATTTRDTRDRVFFDCGKRARMLPCAPAVHLFPEGVFEHIGPDPVYVHDKAHLKRLTKRYKCHAPGLLDGGDYGKEI